MDQLQLSPPQRAWRSRAGLRPGDDAGRRRRLPPGDEALRLGRRHPAADVYGEAMLRTAGPERMRHLEQPLANQDHLPGLVAQARRERAEPSRG